MHVDIAVDMSVYIAIQRPSSALARSCVEVLCFCSGIELKVYKASVRGEKVK